MSVKIMSLVFDLPFKPKHKLIMLCLANYANDSGENVYPSLTTIQKQTSLSRPAVTTAMRDLLTDGFLLLERRGDVHRKSSRYRINVKSLVALFTSKADLLVNAVYHSLVKEIYRTSKCALPNPLDDPKTIDPLISADKPHKPHSKKPAQEVCPVEWMSALHDLCGVDVSLASSGMRKRISETGKALIKAGAKLEDVERFAHWWTSDKWRAENTPIPTPEKVRDNWSKMNGYGKGSNHANTPRSTQPEYTAEDIEMAERINARRAAKAAGLPAVQ